MSADLPAGLAIGGVLPREDPRDAVVLSATSSSPPGTPSGKIATGSIRRVAQLRTAWPDARFEPVRGNVDTRLRKLDAGQFDALVLAAAGLRRLGFGNRISALIPFDTCVPAPGQGAIAIETREHDDTTRAALAAMASDRGPRSRCRRCLTNAPVLMSTGQAISQLPSPAHV